MLSKLSAQKNHTSYFEFFFKLLNPVSDLRPTAAKLCRELPRLFPSLAKIRRKKVAAKKGKRTTTMTNVAHRVRQHQHQPAAELALTGLLLTSSMFYQSFELIMHVRRKIQK
jgi:DNA-binding IclR family transcriptional regulator